MCKMYDAIYELSNHVESDILICSLGHLKVEGTMHKCNELFGEDECYDGVITLKDVKVTCYSANGDEKTKEYKWFNVASKHIQGFAFKCCEM